MKSFFSTNLNPAGLLTALAAVLGCFTLTGFMASAGWLFELTAHFRVQYAASFALLMLTLACLRRRMAALCCGAGMLVNLAIVLPLYFGGNATAPVDASRLRLMVVNVNSSNPSADSVRALIDARAPALVLFMEVNDRWMELLSPLHDHYPHRIRAPREDNFGIALFSRLPLEGTRVISPGDAGVPSIRTQVRVAGTEMLLLGTHPLPPGSAEYARLRNGQLKAVAELMRDAPRPAVLIGDLNTTPWSPHFRQLIETGGLVNSAQGHGIQPTWPAGFWPARIPIDHVLVSPDIAVLDREVGDPIGSDHLPLIVELGIPAKGVSQ
ncbi:MAG TPA: endonuclease/exonuclease/phosphatase family protein [Methylomirabilota bacterium]|nr:endonuclease/exonuclease/phosphatase family protein [Methylomirabilota bacterium]